jgi:hypothetical protein
MRVSDSLDPGNIVYAYILGDHVVVLNSFKAAGDLLTKRGAAYSNRPDSAMTEDMFVPIPSHAAAISASYAYSEWVGEGSTFSCSNQERSSVGAET